MSDWSQGWPGEQHVSKRQGGAMKQTGTVLAYVGLVILHIVTLGYFVPTWVAMHRKAPNTTSIIVINIFLGWLLVGWVVSLAMACQDVKQN